MKVQTTNPNDSWFTMEMIIFTIFFILISANSVTSKPDHEDVKSLTSCVVKMVEEIDYKGKFMDITVMNINNNLNLSALHNVGTARFVSRRFFWNPVNIDNVIYIVMSEDYQELERGFNKVTPDVFWNPSAEFIIVLQSYENYSLQDITRLLHTYNIFYKVSLILRDGADYAIYKYNFTKPGNCYNSGHLAFWSWCSDYRTEKTLPLLNTGSVRNCRYKFVARNLWPFVNFDSKAKGTEQYMLALFEKQYGITIDMQEYSKLDKYGDIMTNLTKVILDKVMHNQFEGIIGGYEIQPAYPGNISYTYPMTIDHMYYTLAHAKYLGHWAAVSLKSSSTCILVGFLFLIFCIVTTLLSIFPTGTHFSDNVLIVFGYILNTNAVKRTKPGWPQAFVFSSLLFTALIIPYTIQAILISVTTEPIRGYEPTAPEDLKPYQAVLYTEWQYRVEFDGHWECGSRINCLTKVKNCQDRNLYTVVSDSYYKIHQSQLTDDKCDIVTYRLKEPYAITMRSILFRRGSVLIRPMNNFVHHFVAAGILNKHASDIYFRELLKCKAQHRSEHVPLTLANFYYIFIILIGGYCLSILIFIYEVRVGSQNNVSRSV